MSQNYLIESSLTIAIFVVWPLLLIRFFLATFSHLQAKQAVRWHIWIVLFLIVAAGTTLHPAVVTYFSNAVGAWFGEVPTKFFAICIYLISSSTLYRDFLPRWQKPKFNWAIPSGILVLILYLIPFSSPVLYSQVRAAFFNYYVLLTTIKMFIPAFQLLTLTEKNPQMILRLRAFLWLSYLAAIWGLNETLCILLKSTYLSSVSEIIRAFLVICLMVVIIISFLAPPSIYIKLVTLSNYVADLATYIILRRTEIYAYGFIPIADLSSLPWREIVHTPQHAIYCSAIALLDIRKALKNHKSPSANILGDRLDTAAHSTYTYPQVVDCLRRIGQRYLWISILGSILNLRHKTTGPLPSQEPGANFGIESPFEASLDESVS